MPKFTAYRCSLCGTEYLPGQVTYTCPKDGGNLDIELDYKAIKKKYQPEDITSRRDFSLWRYEPLLPVGIPKGEATPLHIAGWTPVFKLPRLAKKLGLKHLWLKDESRNPSASFKDRASAILVARAQEIAVSLDGTAREVLLHANDGFRRKVDPRKIKSTLWEKIEDQGATIVLTGRGWGHGVGMCQYGIKQLGEMGYKADTILRYYYPGSETTQYWIEQPKSIESSFRNFMGKVKQQLDL